MPVTVVVGGQFGSEGKGKVSAYLAEVSGAAVIVRVGGPNSGHSAVDLSGNLITLRQLPAAAVRSDAVIVLPAGSLINVDILLREIELLGLGPERVRIDPNASVVTEEHIAHEVKSDLVSRIASSASGTGAALGERVMRHPCHVLARSVNELKEYIENKTSVFMREILKKNERIVIEGTQGFGLSLWQSRYFPFTTSRDTTASSFVAESGLAALMHEGLADIA